MFEIHCDSFLYKWQDNRLSGKCLSFINVFFYNSAPSYKRDTKSVKYVNMCKIRVKYVIRQNNIKQKTLYAYYFLIKQKKLFGQTNTIEMLIKCRFI